MSRQKAYLANEKVFDWQYEPSLSSGAKGAGNDNKQTNDEMREQ